VNALRDRWSGTGLRTRLVIGLLLLTGLAYLGVTAALTVSLHGYLVDRVDDGLSDRTIDHPQANTDGDTPGDADSTRTRGPGTLTLAVDGSAVKVQNLTDASGVSVTGGLSRLTPTDLAAIRSVATDGLGVRTVELANLGSYRMVSSLDPDVPTGRLVIGTSLQSVDDTVRRLTVAAGIGFLFALLAVGWLGWVLIGRSLRPLVAVASTAKEVTATPLATGDIRLEQRVAEPDPRTEIGQVAHAFNAMLEHVESSLQQRESSEDRLRRFVGDASHELRTPIAAIRGWAELVRRAGPSKPDQAAASAARIESAASRMGVLVDELLLLAQLDAGRPLATEPVELGPVVAEAVDEAKAAGSDQHWELDCRGEPVINGDRFALHHVLANLLGNARVHTPPGTTVRVVLEEGVARPDGGPTSATITVCDDGPGIPAELLPRVTERFARGDASRSRGSGGTTGLGLAIAESIVTAHGGTMAVTSDQTPAAHGTRVTISLPLTNPEPTPE